MKKLFSVLLVMVASSCLFAQQTTSSFAGKVTNENGVPMVGAVVEVIHKPTNTQYAAVVNKQGIFRIANAQPGGPYTVQASFLGYNTTQQNNVYVDLGQTQDVNMKMQEAKQGIDAIVVTSTGNSFIDANRMGAQTSIGARDLAILPNASRTIADFARLAPQAKVSPSGSISVAGQNNRYNSFTVDGTLQNDAYGLAGNGTNSGQIGFTPFSMEIIDQFSVEVSPFDVKQSGFSGAGISASTKSGTNDLRISAYEYFRNQALAGKTPTDDPDVKREKLQDFTSNTFGVSVGGPIVKDKLFFFVNGEYQKDNSPRTFNSKSYFERAGAYTNAEVDNLFNKLRDDYNYTPGSYTDINNKLQGGRLFAKLDWNINKNNKFTIRYNYTHATSDMPSMSSSSNINYGVGQAWISTVNSVAAELKTKVNDRSSNYLYIGYNAVSDDRNPLNGNFPYVKINNPAQGGSITFGSENFSMANILDQKILTIRNDFELYSGKHKLTFGTYNEYCNMMNVFIRNNFGNYTFTSLNDFMVGNPAEKYERTYAVRGGLGDESDGAAKFSTLQLGFYAQDEFQINEKFKLTYGLRIDIPMFLTSTPDNPHFNDNVIPEMKQLWGNDIFAKNGGDPRFGSKINAQVLFSPRIGFNWDILGDKTQQLRGGMGIFTSRIPFVWPGGAYSNNGATLSGFNQSTTGFDNAWLNFNPDIANQPKLAGAMGQIDLFAKNFKFPQVFRVNLGYDVRLPGGVDMTIDGIFTQNLNNVQYQNLMVVDADKKLTNGGDDREMWKPITGKEANKYTGIYYATNTSKGYSYNVSAKFQKSFDFGLSAHASYSFNRSFAINEGGSSQNNSQWLTSNIYGMNNVSLKTSVYDVGSRVMAGINYRANYSKYAATIVSLLYTGQHGGGMYGARFGYGYGYNRTNGILGDANVNGSASLTALYVPKDKSDINLTSVGSGASLITVDDQWDALNAYISKDKYLSTRRGQYAEPNSNFTPWENIFDLKIIQEFKLPRQSGREHKIQVSFDVYNLGNLLCKDWGRKYDTYAVSYNCVQLLTVAGWEPNGTTPKLNVNSNLMKKDGNGKYYVADPWSIYDDTKFLNTSRWQAQIGIKYVF